MSGFAMDRAAAEAALRYEPVGAFLVRMCSEPGLFAVSCRTSADMQDMHLDSNADGYACPGMLSKPHMPHSVSLLMLTACCF